MRSKGHDFWPQVCEPKPKHNLQFLNPNDHLLHATTIYSFIDHRSLAPVHSTTMESTNLQQNTNDNSIVDANIVTNHLCNTSISKIVVARTNMSAPASRVQPHCELPLKSLTPWNIILMVIETLIAPPSTYNEQNAQHVVVALNRATEVWFGDEEEQCCDSRFGDLNQTYGLGSINNRGLKCILPRSYSTRGQKLCCQWHFWNFEVLWCLIGFGCLLTEAEKSL